MKLIKVSALKYALMHLLCKYSFYLFLIAALSTTAQKSRKVLFLGNSYTYYNNMPQITEDLALSNGDTLNWSMEAPGGVYLSDHLNSQTSLNQIKNGDWDYVVLQEQSKALTLPGYQIGFTLNSIFKLDSLINSHNTCVETMYYMTWGRKNGDPVFYRVYSGYTDSTYEYMDSLLRARYLHVADTNQAEVTPVGAVWRYLRVNHPNIELYAADESHPSLAGSYAAACSFYTTIFRKNPSNLSYDASLNASVALTIRQAVRAVVYDSLTNWSIGRFDSLKDSSCPQVGMKEAVLKAQWTVYPNPSNGEIQLTLPENFKGSVSIYNSLGQVVHQAEAESEHCTWQLQHLPRGVYTIQLISTHWKATKSLVLQ
jgi:hypothetical protein